MTAPRRMPAAGAEMLRSLYVHRLLTTSQLWELHLVDKSIRYARYVLEGVERDGYVYRVGRHGSREAVWYLSARGVSTTEGSGVEVRRYRMTKEQAAGALQEHSLALNEVGLCFVREARRRGDDCGPFDWRNETAHPLGPGRLSDTLIADAVLDYTVVDHRGGETFACRFLELDRGTKRVGALAAKLTSYARLYDYAPGWIAYPAFPRLLVVLTGLPEPALVRRVNTLCELAAQLPRTSRSQSELGACAVSLETLRREGPFAPVFIPLLDPDARVDLLGR